ncbi:hypothetical protein TSOC_014357, partial [Tetrabaena socialis]
LLLPDPASAATRAAILTRWSQQLPAAISEWGESEEELTKVFEVMRNDWMNNRTESWMALQVPYAGVAEALRECPFPFYIASSKAGHRVSALATSVLR